MNEAELLHLVLDLAQLRGWLWQHEWDSRRKAGRTGSAGCPDLILLRPPRLLWVELKTARGRLSSEQQEWKDQLQAAGQEYYLWRPADWPHIMTILA